MKHEYPYVITPTSVVVAIGNRKFTVHKGHEKYEDVRQAIKDQDFESIPDMLDLKGKLISETNGGLYLLNGMLRCDKYVVPTLLASRISQMCREGFDIQPLTLFLENLMRNPNESGTIVEEIYDFIEAGELPITADGCFLAYKMVKEDFTDIWSGRMDNSVGSIVQMDRADCDFNRGRTCSSGLHFCSEGYLGHYGSRRTSQVVVVKVNPRDVTSIPTDYNNAKGRACKYEVVDSLTWDEAIKPLFTTEHSDEVPEVDPDSVPDPEGYRWEVRESGSNDLLHECETRQGARDFRAGNPLAYIWDNVNREVVAGKADYTEGEEPEVEPEVEEETPAPVSSSAVLTEKDVHQIREILRQGAYDSLASLAKMFGVSPRQIGRIRDWKSWTHIT